jgi:hypothetical protein
VAAVAVILLHGFMLAALTHAFSLGYLVVPHAERYSSAMTVPPQDMVVTFVSSVGHDKTATPFTDREISKGALRDVQAEIIQPRDFTLPEVETSVAAAPSSKPEAGEVRILCEVHVHQGHSGDVQAVDFGACNGDSVWQRSLLRSIQQAARLITPAQEGEFPPVRILLMDTASPSPDVLARQLSEPIARR